MERICFLNGRWLSEKVAKISVLDAGFLYGYGVFETIRITNGRAFLLSEHLKRLKKSLHLIKLKNIPYDLNSIVKKIIAKNNLVNGIVRITVTPGRFNDLPWKSSPVVPTVLITVRKIQIPEEIYTKGVRVLFVNERNAGASLSLPGVKSISYIANVNSKIFANKKNAFEPIFVSSDGFLKEGAVSNIFFIKNNTVYTPDLGLGILPGITRSAVIKIIKKMGMKVMEGRYKVVDFLEADEAFLTNSTFGVIPVAGKSNLIVNKVREEYERLLTQMTCEPERRQHVYEKWGVP